MPYNIAGPTLATLGKIEQIAFICNDLEAEVRYWVEKFGAGPFYKFQRHEKPESEADMSRGLAKNAIALGYFGEMQIELIEPPREPDSYFRKWLDDGGTGIQHFCILVDDFDAAHAAITEAGGVAVIEADIPGLTRVSFFEMPGPQPMVEVQKLSDSFARQWRQMREAAKNWNGVRPFRPFSDLALQ